MAPRSRRLDVFLVRPSKYDDDGYVLRHFRGVLPSNTLACLHALTRDVAARRLLGDVAVRSHLCDDSVQRVPYRAIRRAARRRGGAAVVCLVGVQTSQFPRAADLARRVRAARVPVLVGGFHVSGSLAPSGAVPRELQSLLDLGVTLVNGEVEDAWPDILRHAAAGTLAPVYDLVARKPDLASAPVPRLEPRLMRRFAFRHFGTIDAGRGCPFSCSFCTIINVQGRAMRARDPQRIAAAIAENYRALGTHHYFFTDDDFARNPHWRRVFAELIRLREERGVPVRFLMQVDALAHRIPGFIALARRAGCFQVFIGIESLSPESLREARKRQNAIGEYRDLLAAWHHAGILTHVGYVLGFPRDTAASIRDGVRQLRDALDVDLASFFMLTPLPGSADHAAMLRAATACDADLNRHDTFHPVVDHPRMSRAEWAEAYEDAWRDFYSFDHMRRRLRAADPANRTTLLQLYLWYRAAIAVERHHPMMTGFGRLKPRRERRPGLVIESRRAHARRRIRECAGAARGYARVLAEMRRLWLDTAAPATEDAASRGRWRRLLADARTWLRFARALTRDQPPALARRTPRDAPAAVEEPAPLATALRVPTTDIASHASELSRQA